MQLHREGLSRLGYGELVTGRPGQTGLLIYPGKEDFKGEVKMGTKAISKMPLQETGKSNLAKPHACLANGRAIRDKWVLLSTAQVEL